MKKAHGYRWLPGFAAGLALLGAQLIRESRVSPDVHAASRSKLDDSRQPMRPAAGKPRPFASATDPSEVIARARSGKKTSAQLNGRAPGKHKGRRHKHGKHRKHRKH